MPPTRDPAAPPRGRRRRPARRAAATHAPVTDAQSGGGYQLPRRARRKASPTAGPAGPVTTTGPPAPTRRAHPAAPGPPTGMSEQDREKVTRHDRQTQTAVKRAKSGKTFNAEHLRDAIAAGQAPDVQPVKDDPNQFLVTTKRHALRPDDHKIVRPASGDKKFGPLNLTDRERVKIDAQVMGDAVHAPVLKILDATSIPVHAIAGTVAGHSPGYGVRHKTTFGKILKDAGAPGIVQGVGGFALDVAADPTTYVTFGAGSVAKKAAEHEAARVAEQAAKAGMTEQGAETVARRAASRAETNTPAGKGATVSFAGREVPGVRKATAATGRVVKRAAGKAPGPVRAAAGYAKDVAREVRPTIAPTGAHQAEFVGARRAARKARSTVNQKLKEVQSHAEGLKARIGPENYERVIDAVERGQIGRLPEELRQPAVFMRSQYRYAKRVRQRAGLGEGTIGKRRQVEVPEVTADVQASRERLNAARRERARQERTHEESLAGFGVARGRAQILSRNVSGTKAERRAQARTVGADENQFAGGGHGVQQAAAALQAGTRNVAAARDAVRRAEAEHEATIAAARAQRVARRRAEKTRAAREGEAVSYFPHAQEEPLLKGLGIIESDPAPRAFSGGGRTLARPGSAQSRTLRVPVADANKILNDQGKGAFSTDVPLVHLNYMTETAKLGARSQLWKDLAAQGRRLKPTQPAQLRDGDAIYHLGYQNKKFGLHEISDADWKAGHYRNNGQFVALNKKTVDDALASAQPAAATHAITRGYDKFTRGFKTLATATPGFHARNFVGDTQMAYLSQPGHKLPGNIIKAGGALKVLSRQERGARDLAHDAGSSGKTIKVAGKDMPVDDFLAQAREHGVVRSGFIGRELEDLAGTAKKRGQKAVRRRVGRGVKRWMQNREDLMRLATFKHGLDEGKMAAEAADLSLETHIDYGDLTTFERKVARRAMPFYTFSARALPLHAKRLASNPGKFANIEKAREEIAAATGIDLGQADTGLPEYQQRQAPVVMKIAGQDTVISDALPLTLLNELPTGTSPGAYGVELGQFLAGLANPLGKDPVELYANKSFFFRDDIEHATSPLVAAPDWVAVIPASLRKQLGIVPDKLDKRSGRKVWGWPAKLDYVVKSFPGPVNAANQIASTGTNRRGQGTATKILSATAGVKVQPLDPASEQLNRLYDERAKIEKQMAALRQRGINADQSTPEYRRLQRKMKQVMAGITTTAQARGDKVLPGRRRRKSSGGFGGSGGGSGGSGGSGSFGSGSGGGGGSF